MAIEEALLAVSANRTVADAGFGHPVNGIAERAGEVNGRIHGSGFSEDDCVLHGCDAGLSQAPPGAGIALCAESRRYDRRINNC